MSKLNAEALEFFRKEGAKGGKARAKKLTKEERIAGAKKAIAARWAKQKKKYAD